MTHYKTLDRSIIGRPRLQPKRYGRNSILPGVAYALRWGLYGFYGVTTSTALTLQTLFNAGVGNQYTPAGGAQLNLTNWHTDLQQGAKLPNPERFYCRGLALSIDSGTMPIDARRFLRDTLVTLTIGTSTASYWQTHAFKLPSGGGLYGASAGILSNGLPLADAYARMWGPPMVVGSKPSGANGPLAAVTGMDGDALTIADVEVIEQDQNFGVTLDPTQVSDAGGNGVYTTNANGVGISAHLYLEGVKVRGVQG